MKNYLLFFKEKIEGVVGALQLRSLQTKKNYSPLKLPNTVESAYNEVRL